jgi:hypothetical protein
MTCQRPCALCAIMFGVSAGVVNLASTRSQREEAGGVPLCDGAHGPFAPGDVVEHYCEECRDT